MKNRLSPWLSFIIALPAILTLSCSEKLSKKGILMNPITIVHNDTVLTFGVWNDQDPVEVNLEKRYHYYVRNTIQSAQGGYIGKPLDGAYTVTTRSNVLCERGSFREGAKSGEWITWYGNGNIQNVTSWKEGRKSGKFRIYNERGVLLQEGQYKNDRLTGKLVSYDALGKKSILRYNDGTLIEEKPKETGKKKKEEKEPRKAKKEVKESSSAKKENGVAANSDTGKTKERVKKEKKKSAPGTEEAVKKETGGNSKDEKKEKRERKRKKRTEEKTEEVKK